MFALKASISPPTVGKCSDVTVMPNFTGTLWFDFCRKLIRNVHKRVGLCSARQVQLKYVLEVGKTHGSLNGFQNK